MDIYFYTEHHYETHTYFFETLAHYEPIHGDGSSGAGRDQSSACYVSEPLAIFIRLAIESPDRSIEYDGCGKSE